MILLILLLRPEANQEVLLIHYFHDSLNIPLNKETKFYKATENDFEKHSAVSKSRRMLLLKSM